MRRRAARGLRAFAFELADESVVTLARDVKNRGQRQIDAERGNVLPREYGGRIAQERRSIDEDAHVGGDQPERGGYGGGGRPELRRRDRGDAEIDDALKTEWPENQPDQQRGNRCGGKNRELPPFNRFHG
jgi:hypothetical protein